MASYYGEQYQQYENTVGVLPVYREKIRGLIPYHIQKYIWANCHETDDTNQKLKDCTKPKDISGEYISVLIEEIKQNELINDLRFWTSNINVGLNIIHSHATKSKTIIQLIKEIQEQ